MTDDELTDGWEAILSRAVTHDEHLRIAYTLHRRHGRDEARRRLLDGTAEAIDAVLARAIHGTPSWFIPLRVRRLQLDA